LTFSHGKGGRSPNDTSEHSPGAFIRWNRGVAIVVANAAGFTLHLLTAFCALPATVFFGEAFHAFHAAGNDQVRISNSLPPRGSSPGCEHPTSMSSMAVAGRGA